MFESLAAKLSGTTVAARFKILPNFAVELVPYLQNNILSQSTRVNFNKVLSYNILTQPTRVKLKLCLCFKNKIFFSTIFLDY